MSSLSSDSGLDLCSSSETETEQSLVEEQDTPSEQTPSADVIMNMTEAARQLRRLCSNEQVSVGHLTEAELFDTTTSQLTSKVDKRSHPNALVISSSILQRTVLRLVLVRAGFQVAEAIDIRDGMTKLRISELNAIFVDINSTGLDRGSLLHVVRNNSRHFVPVIAIMSPSVDAVGHSTDEVTPHQAVLEGFDTFVRRPVDNVLGVLCSVFMSPATRVTELSHLASANYARINTVLAEVSDRSLYYKVKETSRIYQGVVKGSVETHPAYLQLKLEVRGLRAELAELHEQEQTTAVLLERRRSTIEELSAETSVLRSDLANETREREEQRRHTAHVLSERYIESPVLQETPLSQRLRFDRDLACIRKKCDRLASRLASEQEQVLTLQSERDELKVELEELTAELEYTLHKESARHVESFVLKSLARRKRDSAVLFNAHTQHAEHVSSLGEQVRLLEDRMRCGHDNAYRTMTICSRLEKQLMQAEDIPPHVSKNLSALALPVLFNKKLKDRIRKVRAAKAKRTVACQTVALGVVKPPWTPKAPCALSDESSEKLVNMKKEECDSLMQDLTENVDKVSVSILGERYSDGEVKVMSKIAIRCVKDFKSRFHSMLDSLPRAVNDLIKPSKNEQVGKSDKLDKKKTQRQHSPSPPRSSPVQPPDAPRPLPADSTAVAQGVAPTARPQPPTPSPKHVPAAPLQQTKEASPTGGNSAPRPIIAEKSVTKAPVSSEGEALKRAVTLLHRELMKLLLQCKLRSKITNIKLADPLQGKGLDMSAFSELQCLELLGLDQQIVAVFTHFYEAETDTLRAKMKELLRKNVQCQISAVKACQTGYLYDSPLMAPAAQLHEAFADGESRPKKEAIALPQARTVLTYGSQYGSKSEGSYFPRRMLTNKEFFLEKARMNQKRARAQYLQTAVVLSAAAPQGSSSALMHVPVAPLLPPV